MLATTHHPAQTQGDALPLLIVHGLFGSGRNWGVIARRLADRRDVVTLDLRNHGGSPWYPTHSYPDMAGDLAEVIDSLGGRADVVGHSMGGKVSMWLALSHPQMVGQLVVADIAPVSYDHDNLQYSRAMRAMDLTGRPSRAEADRRLALGVQDDGMRAFFLQSLDLKSDPPRWRLNLDVLEAEMPKIIGWPETAAQFTGRTLFLTGALSNYVRPEHRPAILARFPAARFVKLPGAGHWLHADKPREFEETVQVFLSPGG